MIEFPESGTLTREMNIKGFANRYGTNDNKQNLERLYNELLEKKVSVERVMEVDFEESKGIRIISKGKYGGEAAYLVLRSRFKKEKLSDIEESLSQDLVAIALHARTSSGYQVFQLNLCLHTLEELSKNKAFVHGFDTEEPHIGYGIVEFPKAKLFAFTQFLKELAVLMKIEENGQK